MSQRRQLREAQDEPPVPLSGAAMILEPDPVLSSLSLPLCLSVARGLACYVLVLTTSQSWDFIPVACKVGIRQSLRRQGEANEEMRSLGRARVLKS